MKKAVALSGLLILTGFSVIACHGGLKLKKPPSGLFTRVLASQDVSSLTSQAGLIIIDGARDRLPTVSPINVGSAPTWMAVSPTRATALAFDASSNRVVIVSTATESVTGTVQLSGPTNSLVVPATSTVGYAAEPTAVLNGQPPGAVEMMNLLNGGIMLSISVPGAQTVVANPTGTQLLVFSNDSNAVTVVNPNITAPPLTTTTTVAGFDRPVYALLSGDGSTAYILNCGAQCGGTQASVQTLNLASLSLGTAVPVDGATFALLSGSTLYVAGTSPTNNACTGQTTAATTCGRLDLVDIGSMTVTGSVVITDGYHDRMDLSSNRQLFIGANTCTNIGDAKNPQGEVRGCLSIFNTTNSAVVIPPANGDVTGLQSFTTRNAEYVAEGGTLSIYDTTTDALQKTQFISNVNHQPAPIGGQVIDVKAIDFF